jgi:alpha-2-macroglobulin-like protein
MYYSFALWICSLIASSQHYFDFKQPNHKTQQDTTFFDLLSSRLEQRKATTAPEKVYLHIDRTLLEPGESVWFTAYVRNADNLQASNMSDVVYVEVLNPQQQILQTMQLDASTGAAKGEYNFLSNLPGGIYTLRAYTNWMKNTNEVFERTITLQKTVLPNLNLKMEFERKAHGPGDICIARLDAHALDNTALSMTEINGSIRLDGQETGTCAAKTDQNGRAYLRFELPKDLQTTDGLLQIQIQYKGSTESISRAIPIVLNRIDLTFFPEGGDAIEGLPCRMGFKAVNEFGKAADIEGEIVNEQGHIITTFGSYHNGMGAFEFVPNSDKYKARIMKPFESDELIVLPDAKPNGYALRVQSMDDQKAIIEITGTKRGKLHLVVVAQDSIVQYKSIQLATDETYKVLIPTINLPMGIVRVTLFDDQKNALAERLFFVGHDRRLKIDIQTDQTQYLPRQAVNMQLLVRDNLGKPVKGRFSLAVCDENQLVFADDKQGHILASMLLEQEVRGEIEEPNFYFDPTEPKSQQSLDYLLMTQGWRRFQWKDVLDATPFKPQFAAQKSMLAGVIYDDWQNPMPFHTINLYPNGPSQKTDQNGKFRFAGFDLTKYSHIQYQGDRFFPINGIYNDLVVFSSKPTAGNHLLSVAPTKGNKTLFAGNILGDNTEPIYSASIKLFQNGKLIKTIVTDMDGNFKTELLPGKYDLMANYIGFPTFKLEKLEIKAMHKTDILINLESGTLLDEVVVTSSSVRAGRQERSMSAQTLTSNEMVALKKTKNKEKKTKEKSRVGVSVVPPSPIPDMEITVENVQEKVADFANLAQPAPPMEVIADDLNDEDKVPGATKPIITGKFDLATRSGKKREIEAGKSGKKRIANEAQQAPNNQFGTRYFQYTQIREFYAPNYALQSSSNTIRNDFRKTLYWNPDIRTDEHGYAQLQFFTSDAISNFRATIEGFGGKGQIARAEKLFFVQKPVDLSANVPAYIISGDTLQLMVAMTNHTQYPASGELEIAVPKHFIAIGNLAKRAFAEPSQTQIIPMRFLVGHLRPDEDPNGSISVALSNAEALTDGFTVPIKTLQRGFPTRFVMSTSAVSSHFQFDLKQPIAGSISAKLTAYPNTLTDILKGTERMLNQPNGCFEQVSSSNYPNLLVLDLLHSTGTLLPEVEARAMQYLQEGYNKLAAYECKSGGFDWWGRDPGHEGLTAYGLLEFKDMSNVFKIDKSILDRTIKWLLSRRDGKGGWLRRPDHLDSWNNNDMLGAYIAWATTEAGYHQKFQPEIEAAYQQALLSDDAYQLALIANAFMRQHDQRADQLLKNLLVRQEKDGSWTGKTHSVTHSQGKALSIETTALVVMALLQGQQNDGAIVKAIQFLSASKNEYGYGNTQSTVMAMRALVQYAKKGQNKASDTKLIVQVNGKKVSAISIAANESKPLEINDLAQYFTSENQDVEIHFEPKNAQVPVDLEVQYTSLQPADSPNCPLQFTTNLSETQVSAGATVRFTAQLFNSTAAPLASPMAILGVPAGLTLQPWQLKKLQDEHLIDFYEIWDGFVVFHFESLAANSTRTLNLDLRADIAGTFEAPASLAYLYYNNEQRIWSKPQRIRIR